jgi:hypothetical protein
MAKKAEKKENFKVIIAGSRGFSNYKLLHDECNKYLREKKKTHNVIIVSGNARGADSLGEKYANDEKLGLEIFPADWKKFGKAAGFRRNEQMAEFADALIAFWDGKSHGTKHMIDIATDKGMQIKVVNYGKI